MVSGVLRARSSLVLEDLMKMLRWGGSKAVMSSAMLLRARSLLFLQCGMGGSKAVCTMQAVVHRDWVMRVT